MDSGNRSQELLRVRLLLVIPLLILIPWAIRVLMDPMVMSTGMWSFLLVFTVSISVALVLMIKFAQIPEYWGKSDTSYFTEEFEEQEKVFVIPTRCKHCQTPIELDRVRWKDSYTLLCQECQSEIKIKQMEK